MLLNAYLCLSISALRSSRTEVMVINEMSGRLERAGDYATEVR